MKKYIKISLITVLISVFTITFITHCTKKNSSKLNSIKKSTPAKLFLNAIPVLAGTYDEDIALWVDQYYDFYNINNTDDVAQILV